MRQISLSRLFVVSALALFFAAPSFGQTLFPGVTGQALLDSLVLSYKPASTLSYNNARDTLFSVVLNAGDDSLHSVYASYVLYLDPLQDPTMAACNGDGDNSSSTCNGYLNINTEHAWPQSYGAGSGQPKKDMHHLFPARADVNSTRSNYPYAEINDADTDKWFYKTTTLTTPPTTNVTLYAEYDSGINSIEPPEARKGDIARAMFYFYSMYKAEADAAVASNSGLTGGEFFLLQENTLRTWNDQDPPDTAERARSTAIAFYQDGKENPFVLDPTLVDRAYFSDLLAVELSSFKAVASGNSAVLNWTTSSETNNAGFEIQHRDERTVWDNLGFVEGSGSTNVPRAYTYSISGVAPGCHHFRLRQVDFDGRFSFSPEVSLSVSTTAPFVLTEPYPNPFASTANFILTVARTQPVRIDVVDVLGRRVETVFEGILGEGEARSFRLDGSHLAGGLYLIRARGTDFVTSRAVTRFP